MSQRSTVALVLIALFVAWPRQAHAYLDPASGSLLLQLVLGGVAGLVLFFKLFWHRVRSLFGLETRDDDEPAD